LKRGPFVIMVVVLVIILDQWLKIWIKTNLHYGEEFNMLGLEWARIHFVENPGMAFGLELAGDYGKLILSLFRIVVVTAMGYYLYILVKEKVSYGMLLSIGLIMAGALGNIIDSAFYGLIFSASSSHSIAEMFPVSGFFPDWFPFWGGEPFLFFRPVFNLADSAITTGVFSIILFYRHLFQEDELEASNPNEEAVVEEVS